MKQLIPIIVLLFLILSLTACTKPEENNCTFYYLRTSENIRYGREDALVAPVTREISAEDPELTYLLQLYLDGPVEEGYFSPIPKGTYVLSTLWQEETLVLILSEEFSTATNMTLTLSGACFAATCHDLTGTERIEIRSGFEVYTFDLTDYTFLDDSTGQ